MTEAVFSADPIRLVVSAIVGIAILLLLIIKFKLHPVLSLLISALVIGVGSGMPVTQLMDTVEYGAGNTLQGIVLLIGLGSMFGGILEVSGGAQSVAQTMINKFGEKKAGWALGITGLVVGTTVFFEAGVVILIPLAFGLAKKTKKSTLTFIIPLLAGLASGFAFIPPSAGSVLVANMLGVNLGIMIAVGVPVGIIAVIVGGIIWGRFCEKKIYAELPSNMREIQDTSLDKKLPPFGLVFVIILIPLVLILMSTISNYIPMPSAVKSVFEFFGEPFVALIIATLAGMFFLGKKQGYSGEDLKKILDRALPLILVAFLIAGLIRTSVGAAVVSMTMTAGIMASMPAVQALPPLQLAAMVCAINGGATAFSHVNDSGFWLVGSLLEIDEKTTLKSWTVMETIIGLVGLVCALAISLFA